MNTCKNLNELEKKYECEWVETRGRFTRVTTYEPDGSAWYCNECESTEVCPYEDRCDHCDEDYELCDE